MRSGKIAGLVLALMVGAASAALAQQPPQSGERQHKSGHEQARKHQAGFGMLLRGIELTAEQKAQLEALRARRGEQAHTAEHSQIRERMRVARESGDTAALRQVRTQMAAEMKQRRERMIAELRGILTPSQREVFERNVAAMQSRAERVARRPAARRP